VVAGVEPRAEQQDGGDPPDHLGDVLGLAHGQVTAQDTLLAVAEPLLDDLVAADRVAPDALRDVLPEDAVVEIDIAGRLAEEGEDGRLAGVERVAPNPVRLLAGDLGPDAATDRGRC